MKEKKSILLFSVALLSVFFIFVFVIKYMKFAEARWCTCCCKYKQGNYINYHCINNSNWNAAIEECTKIAGGVCVNEECP
jgi:hypothetical protein